MKINSFVFIRAHTHPPSLLLFVRIVCLFYVYYFISPSSYLPHHFVVQSSSAVPKEQIDIRNNDNDAKAPNSLDSNLTKIRKTIELNSKLIFIWFIDFSTRMFKWWCCWINQDMRPSLCRWMKYSIFIFRWLNLLRSYIYWKTHYANQHSRNN